MTTVAPGTTFFFRAQVLVGHVWEQEETGLSFKRPLLAPWTEQGENLGILTVEPASLALLPRVWSADQH